jgi:hypothetical protein
MSNLTKAEIAQALKHPLRRKLLSTFIPDRLMSPSEAASNINERLSDVSYHVKVLVDYRFLLLRAKEEVRGAQKNYYLLNDEVRNSSKVREFIEENPSMGLD